MRTAEATRARARLDGSPPKGTLNQARWSEILDSAEQAFLENGYEATTIEEIASRVGLLKGSLYYYVHNKADLFYEISTRSLDRHLLALREDPDIASGDAMSRMSAFMDQYMAQIDRNCRWNATLERELRFLEADQLRSIDAIRFEIHALLRGIVVQGISEGVFERTTDPAVAANGILSLLHPPLGWLQPVDRRSSLSARRKWYKTFILKGLAGPPARAGD